MGAISQGFKTWAKHNKMNIGMTAVFMPSNLDDYEERRANGDGALVAGAATAFDVGTTMFMNLKQMTAIGLLTSSGDIVDGLHQADTNGRQLKAQKYAKAFSNAQFNDTEQVHTMRQAGMAMLQRSKYNTQAALMGNEAKYMYK